MSKSLIARLAAFGSLTALLAVALHLAISWSLRRVTATDLGAFNRAMQGRVNADIVVIGSSRAFRHYDPRTLARETGLSCFNLSRNASLIDVQLGVLQAYLHHNARPRLVILNLDLHSFALTKPGEVYDPAQYVPYLGDPAIDACLGRINGQLWKWKYVPLYAYAVEDTLFTWTLGLRSLCGLAPREPCYDGFSPVPKPWTHDFERFKQACPQGIDVEIDAGGVAAMQELIALCQREGIRVMLVYSPQYYEMIALTRNRERVFALFRSIAGRNGVPFLDYSRSPISQTRDFFYNSQHLNARGAAVFSEDLARRLATMGFAAGPARPAPPQFSAVPR